MNKDQERAVKIIGAPVKSFAFYPQSNIHRLIEFQARKNLCEN